MPKSRGKSIFILRKSIVVVLLVLFPCLIFIYRLQFNPPGFFIDESIYGFEAYTILKTGGFSSSGEFLPRLFDPGHHGLYTYLVAPFIGLFGMNEVSVRLASVFSSISLLVVLYFLMRNRVFEWSILLTALWWPLTSWVFLLSRNGMELMTYALITTLVLWTLIKMNDSKGISNLYILWFDILTVFLFFIYPAGMIMAPGYWMLALVVMARKRVPIQYILKLILAPAIILLLSLPYIQDHSIFYRSHELTSGCGVGVFTCLINNVASHFDFRSYFANTYLPPDFPVSSHSIIGTSLILRPLAFFLLAGVLVCLYKLIKRDSFSALLLAGFVLGIIPATLTIRGFDSYRSVALLPILFMIIMLGFDACIRLIRGLPSVWRVFSLVIFLAGTVYFGCQEVKYLFGYEDQIRAAVHWEYGYRLIYNYFLDHYSQYDEFVVTDTIAYEPDLYIRFYDPDSLHTKIRTGSMSDMDGNSKALFAARRWEVDLSRFTVYNTIYYPNGHLAAFYIGVPVPPEYEK